MPVTFTISGEMILSVAVLAMLCLIYRELKSIQSAFDLKKMEKCISSLSESMTQLKDGAGVVKAMQEHVDNSASFQVGLTKAALAITVEVTKFRTCVESFQKAVFHGDLSEKKTAYIEYDEDSAAMAADIEELVTRGIPRPEAEDRAKMLHDRGTAEVNLEAYMKN